MILSKRNYFVLGILFLLVAAAVLLMVYRQEEKVYRVGILSGARPFRDITDGFKTEMTQLGYIEGENIIYDLHELDGDHEEEKRVSRKFVEDKVDLIFAFSTEAALTAKAAAKDTAVPVVFAMGTIENTGLVETVRRPGGNITGVRFNGADLIVSELEIFLKIAPNTKRIWIIHDTTYPAGRDTMKVLRSEALSHDFTLVETHVGSIQDIKTVLRKRSELKDIGVDAIEMVPDVFSLSPPGFTMIRDFAARHKIPVNGGPAFAPSMGSVLSGIPENIKMGEKAAFLADKVLRGTPAGTIPVITPDQYLRINYKVIQELGLEVPEDILHRADQILR